MTRLFAFVGKFTLFLAAMAILTALSLFIAGAYAVVWPILRVSPQNRKLQSVMGLAVAGMAVAQAFKVEPATGDTDATENSREGVI